MRTGSAQGTAMSDSDWVEDVKRWCQTGAESVRAAATAPAESESAFLGYEAAHPALQAHHWPDAPAFSEPRP
jgi:hypothetical protein